MPRSAFLRRRSATIATPEEERQQEQYEVEEEREVLAGPAAGESTRSHTASSLTREVLSKSLTGGQTRRLQKSPSARDKHKRYSSVDATAFSLNSDEYNNNNGHDASATGDTNFFLSPSTPPPLTSPSVASLAESTSSTKEAKPHLGKLKRVSSRIWGGNNNSNSHTRNSSGTPGESPTTPARSPVSAESRVVALNSSRSTSLSASPNGPTQLAVNHAQHVVAQELLPKRLVQGWFNNLHPASAAAADSGASPQSSSGSTGSFAQRLSSPLKNMTHSPRAPPAPTQSTPSSSSAAPTRLFDRKWVDKATNYLFDTDANVDKSPDEIWLLGVCHPGYRDPAVEQGLSPEGTSSSSSAPNSAKISLKRRRRKSTKSHSLSPVASHDTTASTSSSSSLALSDDPTPTGSTLLAGPASEHHHNPVPLPTLAQTAGWPPSFFLDFTSRIQLTYRSGFAPIVEPPVPEATPRHQSHQSLPSIDNGSSPSNSAFKGFMGSIANTLGRKGDGEGLTTDAGWGCMLRTGQSLLANALAKHHLGRDWRRPLSRPTPANASSDASLPNGTQMLYPPEYARYARLVSWFLDDPAPTSPFSVHRFALVGKKLGKEVGQWFGPSTAAGAIKTLCQEFPAAQMGVAAAVDATIHLPDIVAVSESWSKPVLILLNLRLGLNGVNPIYHPPIKSLFTFPQIVGIAGGRPSSSYYFVGAQAESLFYIDPHYSKPAVPVPRFQSSSKDVLLELALHQPLSPSSQSQQAEDDWEQVPRPHQQNAAVASTNSSLPSEQKTTKSAPSPPALEITSDESIISEEDSWVDTNQDESLSSRPTRPSSQRPALSAASFRETTPSISGSQISEGQKSDSGNKKKTLLDDFYSRAYAPSELASFHPERVRRMAISGLDPSMLIGFLVRSQEELDDWVQRSEASKPALYSVQRHIPGWHSSHQKGQGSAGLEEDAGRSDSWDISDSEEDLDVPEDSSKASTQPTSPKKPPHAKRTQASDNQCTYEQDGNEDEAEEVHDSAEGALDQSSHTINR